MVTGKAWAQACGLVAEGDPQAAVYAPGAQSVLPDLRPLSRLTALCLRDNHLHAVPPLPACTALVNVDLAYNGTLQVPPLPPRRRAACTAQRLQAVRASTVATAEWCRPPPCQAVKDSASRGAIFPELLPQPPGNFLFENHQGEI